MTTLLFLVYNGESTTEMMKAKRYTRTVSSRQEMIKDQLPIFRSLIRPFELWVFTTSELDKNRQRKKCWEVNEPQKVL